MANNQTPVKHVAAAPRPAGFDTDLLTAEGVAWIQAHRLFLVIVAWIGTRAQGLWGLVPNPDVLRYYDVTSRWLEGATPYADYVIEYPPGALLILVVPRLLASSVETFGYIFAALMVAADLAILATLWRFPALTYGRAVTWKNARRYESAVICLAYIFLTGVFSRLVFQRFDLVVALMIAVIFYGALRGWRWYWMDALVAFGIWIKLYPVALLPLVWIHGYRRQTEGPLEWGPFVRYCAMRGGLVSMATLLLFLPFFVAAGQSLFTFVGYHADRGLQIESTAASVLLLLAQVFSIDVVREFPHGATHLAGPLSDLGEKFSAALSPVCFLVVTVRFGLLMRRQEERSELNLLLLRGLLAATLTLIVTSKVFSPQYLLWVAPLACLLVSDIRHELRPLGVHAILINVLTALLLGWYYRDLLRFDLIPTVIIFSRNLLVAWLVIELCRGSVRIPHAHTRVPLGWAGRFGGFAKRSLPVLSLSLLVAWVAAASFSPTTTNDLWVHLRVGRDILSTGEIPYYEVYSAVAEGRKFIAHEWLSGIVFHLLASVGGGHVLTLFKAGVTVLLLAVLWFSIAPSKRRHLITTPLLALASYPVLARVFVRPHIFTLLFLALWTFIFERWRRDRDWRVLLWLPVMQVPWANLHGAYLFGIVLAATATLGVVSSVLLKRWSNYEQYSWNDAYLLGAITLACALASLINPYGVEIIRFSLDLGGDSQFIRASIYEWKSPFDVRLIHGFALAVTLVLIVWGGLMAHVRRLPLVDICLAALATWMVFDAVRFVCYMSLLGSPMAVRHWVAVSERGLKDRAGSGGRILEVAALGLLLATTMAYGYGYGETSRRGMGWGFGGEMPYEEVLKIHRLGLSGVIYNEYRDGAFIIHSLYPRVRPVMDSRIDIYGPELFLEYHRSRLSQDRFLAYLEKYNVSFVMLKKEAQNIPVVRVLQSLPGSRLVIETKNRLVVSLEDTRGVRRRPEEEKTSSAALPFPATDGLTQPGVVADPHVPFGTQHRGPPRDGTSSHTPPVSR